MNDANKEVMLVILPAEPQPEDFPLPESEPTAELVGLARHANERPNFLRRHAAEAAAVTLLGVAAVSANQLYDYYNAADEPVATNEKLDPNQRATLGLTPSAPETSPSAVPTLPSNEHDLNEEYRRQHLEELAHRNRVEAVAELPIQPVEAAPPLHLTLQTTARSAEQLSDTARQEFPDGVPAVTINVDLGSTDGEPTGVKNSQGQEAYLINPPHDGKGYYWTKRGTTVGVSRPNPADPAYVGLPEDNQVEIYGHANSVPGGEAMSFQDLKYVQVGDSFTIQTEKGTLTYVITERSAPKKALGAIDDPILTNPMSGQVVLVACLQNQEAGRSTYAVVLRAEVVASQPNS